MTGLYYYFKKTYWGPSIIYNSNSTISLFLREHREYKLKVHKTQHNKRSDYLQNGKSSLFTAVEGVQESCILFYSTQQLIQKFRRQTESYQININLHLSLVLRFFDCSSHIVSKIVHVLTIDRGLHSIFFCKGEFRISKKKGEVQEIRSWERGCRNAKLVTPRKFLEFWTSECVMLSGGGENKVRLGLGERAANRLKNNAVETVCKETSVSREVFQDPGFMTGTRDFKATRGQDSRSKVCMGSGCRKYSTVWDKKNNCEGMSKILKTFQLRWKKFSGKRPNGHCC